ncbi:MAG TPA: ArsR family transcriptional regulator [Thermodesulfobacteriaceae bacterium]|nr:ArsR family transcriptional regulator [Thermodesulfobacteriaceae bacterium]
MVSFDNPRDIDLFQVHASFCSIFSSPVRLKIMWLLGEGERTVGELAEELNLAIPNISQHLKVMRSHGAVRSRREGRTVHYRLANRKFLEGASLIRVGLMEEFQKMWALGNTVNSSDDTSG